jgi:hypothetical protein
VSHWLWGLGSDKADHDIRPLAMIVFGGEHHSGASLSQLGARECARDNIARLQRSSCS